MQEYHETFRPELEQDCEQFRIYYSKKWLKVTDYTFNHKSDSAAFTARPTLFFIRKSGPLSIAVVFVISVYWARAKNVSAAAVNAFASGLRDKPPAA